MKTIKFEGSSDDTFGAYWKGGDVDHDDCAKGSMRIIKVESGDQRLLVAGIFAPLDVSGCWAVGILQVEEDDKLPDWPMRWSFANYSPVLEIDTPDDTAVTLVHPERDDD